MTVDYFDADELINQETEDRLIAEFEALSKLPDDFPEHLKEKLARFSEEDRKIFFTGLGLKALGEINFSVENIFEHIAMDVQHTKFMFSIWKCNWVDIRRKTINMAKRLGISEDEALRLVNEKGQFC